MVKGNLDTREKSYNSQRQNYDFLSSSFKMLDSTDVSRLSVSPIFGFVRLLPYYNVLLPAVLTFPFALATLITRTYHLEAR